MRGSPAVSRHPFAARRDAGSEKGATRFYGPHRFDGPAADGYDPVVEIDRRVAMTRHKHQPFAESGRLQAGSGFYPAMLIACPHIG